MTWLTPRRSDFLSLVCILIFSLATSPDFYDEAQTVVLQQTPLSALVDLLIMASAWLVSVLMLLSAASSRPAIKWSVYALVSASSMSMAAYHVVARKALEYPDYLIMLQARANTLDAVREYATVALVPLGYILVLALGFVLARRRPWASPAAVVSFCLSVGIFATVCVLARGADTNKLPTTTGIYGFFVAQTLDRKAGEVYVYTASDQPEHAARVQNIVLVIDESIRDDFFQHVVGPSLGNGAAQGWHVHDFGLASAMANCSGGSNIMLRKGVRSNDIAQDMYRRPLVWSLAHNAGFASYLLDVQRNGVGHDYFDDTERALIDHRLDVRALQQDAEVLDAMPYLREDRQTFSMVIKRGSHFPYTRNAPAGFQFQGDAAKNPYVVASTKRMDYVNALAWQTAAFFDKLLSMAIAAPTMVIYTSDHGQNVDDQPGLTHCTSSGSPYPGEGLVPLVILTNYPDPALAAAAKYNHDLLSHFNIMPTLLGAMGYASSRWYDAPSAAVTVPQSVPVPGFVYGSPFGYFGSAVQIAPVDRAKALRDAAQRWAQ
ncbi:LTA synthase family protein [Alcaligenaceae bacterium CGII-47]|nr:LTA synthase family protein [Alcaligenaceae bacterium CGII-47]